MASCPEASYFKAIVVERLGADIFADNAPTRVIVQITSRGQTFKGKMQWLDAKGNWEGDRTFPAHSSDCEDLVRAMAFTLALRVQLSAIGNAPPSASASTSTTPAESKETTVGASSSPPLAKEKPVVHRPKVPASEASEPTQGPRIHPTLAAGAGTFIGFGMSSSAIPFARLFGSIAWPHWSLELAAEANLPTITRRPDGAGFSAQQVLASVAGCGALQVWSACLLAKAGAIRIVGKDIDVPASAAGPILETGLRLRATQRIYRSAYASVYAESLVLPIRWAVTLDRSVVWTSPRFAETVGLDVALRFE